MTRFDIYVSVLAGNDSVPPDTLKGELETFIQKNYRWRRYFETDVESDAASRLRANLMSQRVGLLGWLMVCGAVTPAVVENAFTGEDGQYEAA